MLLYEYHFETHFNENRNNILTLFTIHNNNFTLFTLRKFSCFQKEQCFVPPNIT